MSSPLYSIRNYYYFVMTMSHAATPVKSNFEFLSCLNLFHRYLLLEIDREAYQRAQFLIVASRNLYFHLFNLLHYFADYIDILYALLRLNFNFKLF